MKFVSVDLLYFCVMPAAAELMPTIFLHVGV
jgi:hypothetical protein